MKPTPWSVLLRTAPIWTAVVMPMPGLAQESGDELDFLSGLSADEGGNPAQKEAGTTQPSAAAPEEASASAEPYLDTIPLSVAGTELRKGPAEPRRNALIDEIVVTAQKREQSLQDVGIAVSAFSGEALDRLGVQDTADISALVPGFTYADSGYSVPVYTLRGVGFNDISQAGSSTVGVYVDEVILPYPAMTKGSTLDLERVEVLKGPQGTLYGRNTTGGAINYIARKPTDEFEAAIKGGYASFDTYDVEGYLSGPLADGIGGRFAAKGRRAGDWQYDYTRAGVDYGHEESAAARGLLRWDAGSELTVNFALDGWLARGEPQSPQAYVFLDQSAIAGFSPSQRFQEHPLAPDNDARATALDEGKEFYLDEVFLNASARVDWAFAENATWTTILAHQRYNADNHFNQDGMNVEEFEYFVKAKIPATTLETRISGQSTDGEWNWVGGLFLSRDTVDEFRDFYLQDNSTGNGGRIGFFDTIILEGKQESETYAAFGQAEWQATEAFKYTLGLRYTTESRDNYNCSRDKNGDTALTFSLLEIAAQNGAGGLIGAGLTNEQADTVLEVLTSGEPNSADYSALTQLVDVLSSSAAGTGALAAAGGVGKGECFTIDDETKEAGPVYASLEEDNISGKAAIDWTPLDDLRLYGSFSVGYKSGSFPLVPSSNSQQTEPVTQERINAYEIGIKTSVLDGLLRINGAAFHYDYYDKQLFAFYRDQIFGTLQRLDNVPKSMIQGAEIEFQYSPIEALFLSVSACYLESEVQEYRGINAKGENVDFSGNKINYTPPLELSGLVNYEWADFISGVNMVFGADVEYSAATEGELSNDPAFRRGAYTLFGGHAGLRSGDRRWEVTLWGKNLTDEVYYSSLQRLSDSGVRYAGRPRTLGVTFSANF